MRSKAVPEFALPNRQYPDEPAPYNPAASNHVPTDDATPRFIEQRSALVKADVVSGAKIVYDLDVEEPAIVYLMFRGFAYGMEPKTHSVTPLTCCLLHTQAVPDPGVLVEPSA
jgi:hypothetical protein